MSNIILACIFAPIAIVMIVCTILMIVEDERCAKIRCPRYNGKCIGHKCVYYKDCEVVKC